MKNYLLSLFIMLTTSAWAQTKPANLYDSARVYFEKKDYKKAYHFYDTYYSDTTHGQSNYDTFYAAVAGCLAGETGKIGYYLRRSAEIGYDLSSYTYFAEDPSFACLRSRPEWPAFIGPFKEKADSVARALKAITDQLTDTSLRVNHSLLNDTAYWKVIAAKSTPEKILKKLQQFNRFTNPKLKGGWALYYIRVNDTLTAPYLVYIPQNYNPKKASALYIFLHGGVSGPKNFGNPAYEPNSEAALFKAAFKQNAFIIFPFAKKDFNWLYHQEAFETVLKEISTVKSLYHIDDDRVYLGGHSDGGRGAVWFAMNHATPFAAFYGICFFPSLYTGNSPLRNLTNQVPFYAVSATNDQLFPLAMVNQVLDQSVQEGGNWRRRTIKGTHGLPYSAPDSVSFLFDSLAHIKRDPIPHKVLWETDNIKNGRYYWLSIQQLDTAATPAAWHTPFNPVLTGKDGKTGKANFTKHRSGAIKGVVKANVLTVETSCVRTLSLDILPGLVDLKKPVTIMINGQQRFKGMIKPDKAALLASFFREHDRRVLVLKTFTFSL